MRMATDLHGGLVQRQPPPRRFHIYRLSPRIFAAHAGTRTNHGTFQPCAGTSVASVHLYKAGASQYINYFVLPLSYSAQERPLPQAYAPCGCEARGHAYGGDGRIRTSVRRVLPCHSPTAVPAGSCRTQLPLCHISMGGCRSFPAVTAACRLLAVSPDRYTFLLPSCALSPEARSACTSHEHWIWCRRLDSNQRHTSWRGALPTELRLHEGGCSSFRAASQSCDGAQALLRQQSFKRSQTHLLEGELNDLAFGHVSMCPQLQHRGLRGLLQDFASPIRLFRYTLVTRGVHVELEVSVGDRTHDLLITNELLCQLSYDTGSPPCLRPGGRADVRQRGLRPRDRVPARIALGTPEEWM